MIELTNDACAARRVRVAVDRRRSRQGEKHERDYRRDHAAPSEIADVFHGLSTDHLTHNLP